MIAGQKCTLDLTGTLTEEITAGIILISVSFCGKTKGASSCLPLPPLSFDLCSEGACPLKPGPINIDDSFTVPSYAYIGPYTGNFSLSDQNGKTASCIAFNASIANSSSIARH